MARPVLFNAFPSLDPKAITVEDFFRPGGIIAQAKENFAQREGQADLSNLILVQFDAEGHVVAEGPTGFGKSFALLVPAFVAILTGRARRVVVSTETLALAQQYIEQDLPLLQKAVYDATGVWVTFAEAKGRGNFTCFRGSTQVLTRDGFRKIEDLSGESAQLLDGEGNWVDSPVSAYGQQRLWKLNLSRLGKNQEIYTTADHRWFVDEARDSRQNHEVLTRDLKPNDILTSVVPRSVVRCGNVEVSPFGVAAGIVFGDGSVFGESPNGFRTANVTLYGEKRELLRFFSLSRTHPVKLGEGHTDAEAVRVDALPNAFKRVPALDEAPSYLYGWLAGYFATDGSVNKRGNAFHISSATRAHLEYAEKICVKLGILTYPIGEVERLGKGTEPTKLYNLPILGVSLTRDFFVRSKHLARYDEGQRVRGAKQYFNRTRWRVVSVEETDLIETVYCAEVPTTESFVLEGYILTGNCRNRLPWDEEASEFKRDGLTPIQMWAASQKPGVDRGDQGSIPEFVGATARDWMDVGADDDCERRGCPFYGDGAKADGQTRCFVFQARKDFLLAQIVVTNHTLLLLDRANVTRESPDGPLLSDEGGFDMLIVDEAHTLPEKAQNTWGFELSPRTISVTMRGLSRMFRRAGLDPFGDDYLERWQGIEAMIFDPFARYVGKNEPFDKLRSVDVDDATKVSKLVMADMREQLKQIKAVLRDAETVSQPKRDDLLKASTERIGRLYKGLQAIFTQNGSENKEIEENPEMADNWLSFVETSRSQKGDHIKLKVKPVVVAPLMRVKLFETIRCVVIASATLRTSNSFYFPRTRMGIPKEKAVEFVGKTPFDFASAVVGYFPTNLPEPPYQGSQGYMEALDRYNDATADRIADLIEHSKGGGLVLFTSNRSMEDLFWLVRDRLLKRGVKGRDGRPVAISMQGDASKNVLVRRMKDDEDSCLFATKSFFTGVDIPGDGLRLLIMLKAPFPVPSDPMFAAMCQRIEEQGGSSFRDLSMPLMLMDLLQGFGRLIRTVEDTGVFALLDSRANTKNYGKDIRKALPKIRTMKLPADVVVREDEEDDE